MVDLGALALPDADFFRPSGVTIDAERLLRMQGYRDLARVRQIVRRIAEQASVDAEGILAPVAFYRRLPIAALEGDSLVLGPGAKFRCSQFPTVLEGCQEVLIFVLTIGEAVDAETLRRVEQEEIVEALFLETAGWLAVERATRLLHQHLGGLLNPQGLRLTRRLAPGYQDWDLAEHQAFFSLFDQPELPVRLLESCAMLPKKSRSGLYGLQPYTTADKY